MTASTMRIRLMPRGDRLFDLSQRARRLIGQRLEDGK